MSWIAVSGQGQSWACPRTFDAPLEQRESVMPRGSIVIETQISPQGRPQTLLSYNRAHPSSGKISVQALPEGAVVLVIAQGDHVFHKVAEFKKHGRTETLRITFSWDQDQGVGHLAVEQPESDEITTVQTPPPPPVVYEDAFNITQRPLICETHPDVVFTAVSTKIEPIGPMPFIAGRTPVLTSNGFRPLKELRTGDVVQSMEGDLVPVLQRVTRVVPALGSFRPIRLRAPYFGLQRDIFVAPYQRLVIGGSDVEYLFGREAVLLPAISLVNGYAAVYEDGHSFVQYHDLVLPGQEAVYSAGVSLESLYLGRLRRRPEALARSLLADCATNLLPEHARAGLKVLKSFEAITLAEARAA